jgi:hypothetical protein
MITNLPNSTVYSCMQRSHLSGLELVTFDTTRTKQIETGCISETGEGEDGKRQESVRLPTCASAMADSTLESWCGISTAHRFVDEPMMRIMISHQG